jgi:hypothetical protein
MSSFLHSKPRPKGWRTPRPFASTKERTEREEVAKPLRKGEYLAANCVVLAAAIFNEGWAEEWARDLLPAARQLDARTFGL